jgi:hypothetical protein
MFEYLKTWILIIISIILGFVIYKIIWGNDLVFKINKSYEYFGCEIKYKHAFFYTQNHWYNENNCEEQSAKYSLMRCLSEKYIIEKDTSIRNFIFTFLKNDKYAQNNYLRDILYEKDTSFIVKNCELIYKDDRKVLKFIKNYRNKDTIYFKQILVHYIEISNYAKEYYEQIIYKQPFDMPRIDTIIKYYKIIFKFSPCIEILGDA